MSVVDENLDLPIPDGQRALAARYSGGFQTRIILTFGAFAAAWIGVIALGTTGAIPLWLGLVLNSVIASTFYMPMHEATHGNISGRPAGRRRVDDTIGVLSSIPLLLPYGAHRTSHLRHHAHTNDPDRDPDHFTAGPMWALPAKWLSQALIMTLLPVFAFVPPTRRLLPAGIRRSLTSDSRNRQAGLSQLRLWFLSTAALIVAFAVGLGWPALILWYLPARIQVLALIVWFAWFPHHPAVAVGRYVDTRVAVFPGSRFVIRGHDHHAVHHLFPRIPHYRLREFWQEAATELVGKGIRAEGRATGSTAPITW